MILWCNSWVAISVCIDLGRCRLVRDYSSRVFDGTHSIIEITCTHFDHQQYFSPSQLFFVLNSGVLFLKLSTVPLPNITPH
jgi:hypothetical protein